MENITEQTPMEYTLVYNATDDYVHKATEGTGGKFDTLDTDGYEYYEDYEYDYNASVNTFPLDAIPVAVVYGLTLILGIVGNSLVIFCIARYRRLQNVTNIFLTSLAIADLLLVLLCIPTKFTKHVTFVWHFGAVMCKLVHYFQNVSVICSVLTLTFMSVERYYAIRHPMKAKYMCTVQRSRRVIIGIWFLAFVLAFPILIGRVHKIMIGENRTGYWCVKEWSAPIYGQLYELYMLITIFIIPLGIMSFAYFGICHELWRVTSKRASIRAPMTSNTNGGTKAPEVTPFMVRHQLSVVRRSDSGAPCLSNQGNQRVPDDIRQRRQVIKMLVTVIVIFALCWGPFLIDNVLVSFDKRFELNYFELKPMRLAFSLMAYCNSCVNPIVYAFMSKNFRESFKQALKSCCKRNYQNERIRSTRLSQHQMSFHSKSTSLTRGLSLKTEIENNEMRERGGRAGRTKVPCVHHGVQQKPHYVRHAELKQQFM
ncbi:unnamed protein product [Owenia fusiformis]|uniref:Uncharacterized protein n=1 Tax=Owenia fusiformis TaxID=6347 RepID=A0A8J1XYW9_OWEFU|nr:unnamed protein product [Owenia fusiformis]